MSSGFSSMSSGNQAQYADFLATSRNRTVEGITENDLLTTDIHPIFARAKFSNISNFDYEGMSLALRFASQCFSHDGFCRYVDTVTNGIYYDKDEKEIDFAVWTQLDPNKESPERMRRLCRPHPDRQDLDGIRQRATAIMKRLANVVDFTVSSHLPSGSHALCRAVEKGKFPSLSGNGYLLGEISRIELSLSRLKTLTELYANRTKPGYWTIYLERSVETGIGMIHELAHALENAIFGERKEQTFYEDSPFAEAGFQAEALIFGGLHNVIKISGSDHRGLHLWPSAGFEMKYRHRTHPFGRKMELNGYDAVLALPLGRKVGVLRKDFWESEGRGKLLFAGETSYWIFQYREGHEFVPLSKKDDEPPRQDTELINASVADLVQKTSGSSQGAAG